MSGRNSLVFWFVLLLGGSAAQAAPDLRNAGQLIIAGGGVRSCHVEIWNHLLKARLPGKPIGILATASDEALKSSGSYAARINREFGEGSAVAVPLGEVDGDAHHAETITLLRRCGGFYFTGGLQAQTTRVLIDKDGRKTPALDAIWEIYLKGGVIGGSSAGAAIMSDPMISGGNSTDALLRGATPLDTPSAKSGVGHLAGLGFHPEVLYCQHHLERGRFGRLLAALASDRFRQSIGVGVAENTAFLVDHQRQTGTVLGAEGVVYLDTRSLRREAKAKFSGVRLHYLDRGDTIHFSSGKIHPAEGKTEVAPGMDSDPFGIKNPWERDAIWKLLTDLAPMGRNASARARDPNFELVFQKTPQTRVWRQPNEEEGTRPTWTVTDLHVSVLVAAASDRSVRW